MNRKVFNTAGICIPEQHYMVNINSKIQQILQNYIEPQAYFTINRARQYGKTTTLRLLEHALASQYMVIRISFEGKEEYFASLQALAGGLCFSFKKSISRKDPLLAKIFEAPVNMQYPLQDLSERITELSRQSAFPVVLMIDEVDKAADNQTFLSFLGMLRELYLARADYQEPTFHNVILAGVHDIKNLKVKLRPEERHSYNSPWNIAATFDVEMSFSAAEIATMLMDYENDYHTGMDISTISASLYEYTSGYPFLVSCLCKRMADSERNWTIQQLRNAIRDILKEKNTLFDDVIKNIRNHPDFSRLIEQILVCGAQVTFEIQNSLIEMGEIYGIFKEKDGKVMISNRIFETLILNYFSSVRSTYALSSTQYTDRNLYIEQGHLNMSKVLERFSDFMKSEYREEDGSFIECQGRLLFLSFLRPIINGTGHYAVEPQTRKNTRMDIQVFYGNEEFIVELKIWHGGKYEKEAYNQLVNYLESRGVTRGYLLSFCDNRKAPRKSQVFLYKGYEIHEVIVAYRDK